MKRLLLASLACVAMASGSAFAADMSMPFKASPPPAPTWTGCYIDGGGGYGMWNLDQNEENLPRRIAISPSYTDGGRGWLGRFGGGCDYQVPGIFSGKIVIGAFADYDFMNLNAGFSPGNLSLAGNENERDAWYAGGRIGYLVTPMLMTYFDGGYTQTRFSSVTLSGLAAPIDSMPGHTYQGWFLGGGTEYALNFDWIPIHGLFWRNEYRFSSYNSADLPINVFATGAATGLGEHLTPYVQTITSSLVWRFNFGDM
jgi:outer membrane immunogenic protein